MIHRLYITVRRAELADLLCIITDVPWISGESLMERPQDAVHDSLFVRNEHTF